MKKTMYVLFALVVVGIHFESAYGSARCRSEGASDKRLRSSDLRWNIAYADMMTLFTSIYNSGKRLPKRAYWDEADGTYKLPFDENRGGDVTISTDFVASVRNHIEKALQRGYADAVFFSDMGHSHFFIPKDKFDNVYKSIPVNQFSRLYRELLLDSEMQILYHTAEQMEHKPLPAEPSVRDLYLQWRFFTRNLLGVNLPNGAVYVYPSLDNPGNTLRDLQGFAYWGGGFNLSASEQGCFEYRDAHGEIRYFDISLYDLTADDSIRSQHFLQGVSCRGQ